MRSEADTTDQELEETLAQSRASAERRIALYRVWMVGAVGLLSAWPLLQGGSAFSFIFSSAYFAYSLVVLAWARRRLPRWLGEVTLLVDLGTMSLFYVVLPRFDGSGETPRWTLYILPSLMMATLLGNFLRYSDRFAIASSSTSSSGMVRWWCLALGLRTRPRRTTAPRRRWPVRGTCSTRSSSSTASVRARACRHCGWGWVCTPARWWRETSACPASGWSSR
jgi:hypothetical protein